MMERIHERKIALIFVLSVILLLFVISSPVFSDEDEETAVQDAVDKLKNCKQINCNLVLADPCSGRGEDCYEEFYDAVMSRVGIGQFGKLALNNWMINVVNDDTPYKQDNFDIYVDLAEGAEQESDSLDYYKEALKVFDVDYENFDGSIDSIQDVLDDAYDAFRRKNRGKNNQETDFFDSLPSSLNDEQKALLNLWMSENADEDKKKYADDAVRLFTEIAGEEGTTPLQKARLYKIAADTLVPDSDDEDDIEDYNERKNGLMLDHYNSLFQYYDTLEGDPSQIYFKKREIIEGIAKLPSDTNGYHSRQEPAELFNEIVDTLSFGEQVSWRLKSTFDTAALGKSISNKLYNNIPWYRDLQDDWASGVMGIIEIFDMIDPQRWIGELICGNQLKFKGSYSYSTENGRMGSFIAGDRRKFTYNDSSVEYLYKITFMIDAALDSRTGKMNYTIKVYDASGNEFHLDIDNDGKADIWRETEDSYASTREQPIAWYSSKRYDEACIEFYNVDDFVSDFKRLLKDNDNKICTKLAEAKKIYVNQEDTDQGNTQQDDDNDDCANC